MASDASDGALSRDALTMLFYMQRIVQFNIRAIEITGQYENKSYCMQTTLFVCSSVPCWVPLVGKHISKNNDTGQQEYYAILRPGI